MKPEFLYVDDPDPSPDDEGDALLEEFLRDATDPFVKVMSPEQLADHRAFLTVFLTTHPVAAPMFARIRARRRASAVSGEITREGPHDGDTPPSSTPIDEAVHKRSP